MPSHRALLGDAKLAPADRDRCAADERVMAAGVQELLRGCGLDLDHKDLAGTPERVARTWRAEFLAGYSMDPASILSLTFTRGLPYY